MQITIRSRSGKPTDDERTYVEHKLAKLQRYTDGIGGVTVELRRVHGRGAGEMHVVQATLEAPRGVLIRAEERDSDFAATIDALHDCLQRQLTRYKDRRFRRSNARSADLGDTVSSVDGTGDDVQIIRTKRFRYKPMLRDEAIEQMELLDHDFFVFTDARSGQVSVVYRRKDGNYGLIEPELDDDE